MTPGRRVLLDKLIVIQLTFVESENYYQSWDSMTADCILHQLNPFCPSGLITLRFMLVLSYGHCLKKCKFMYCLIFNIISASSIYIYVCVLADNCLLITNIEKQVLYFLRALSYCSDVQFASRNQVVCVLC
jgi:hypothetical protein